MEQEVKERLKRMADKYGYTIIEGALERMTPRFVEQIKKYGLMYCPCQAARNVNTVCPCKYLREYNTCRCALYKKEG